MSNGNAHTLIGRRAVVTGAGRGIGRSIALALAQAGANVAVTARTNAEIEQLVAEIQAMGRQSLAVSCDVTDPDQVKQMATTLIEGLGGIDILVNNAGNAGSHKFLNHPDELWHRMLSINLTSVYYVTKAFVPTLIEQRDGRIINVASIASRVGGSYIAAYTASKHGVLGLTRALAVELLERTRSAGKYESSETPDRAGRGGCSCSFPGTGYQQGHHRSSYQYRWRWCDVVNSITIEAGRPQIIASIYAT